VGAPAALIIGYLADSIHRCRLFAAVILLGESFCCATYWTTTYTELFVLRTMAGISVGGALPILFSLLADIYPTSARVYVSTIIGMAMSLGIGCGQVLAGLVGPAYGWRTPFLIVALPAIACGLLIAFTAHEPARGGQEQEVLGTCRDVSEEEVPGTHREISLFDTEEPGSKPDGKKEVYNAVIAHEDMFFGDMGVSGVSSDGADRGDVTCANEDHFTGANDVFESDSDNDQISR
jgi:MFS family permease